MRVDEEGYASRVRDRARAIAKAAGDGARIFEVGLRAAATMEQHLIALAACKEAGITRTSNVLGAKKLSMIPVGTMGHEHVQRFFSDEAAFRAMKERRAQRSSFLLDTFDTLQSGLPAALEIMAEDPAAHDSIRYDSGDKAAQYAVAVERARAIGVRPVHVIEDGIGEEDVRRFEALRDASGVKPDEQFYGSGGWLVSQTEGPDPKTALTRDKVAAVYKLSKSGKRAVMKLSNDPGKVSVPGVPVAWRRVRGDGPLGMIAQEDEPVRDGYVRIDEVDRVLGKPGGDRVELSDATRALTEETKRAIAAAATRRTP
jgi:nicotinic acid phosphoribosyltransferase